MPNEVRNDAWQHFLDELDQAGDHVPPDAELVRIVSEHIGTLAELLHGKSQTKIMAGTLDDRQNIAEIYNLINDVMVLISGAYSFLGERLGNEWKIVIDTLSAILQLEVLEKAEAACRTYSRIFRYEEAETRLSAEDLYGYDRLFVRLTRMLSDLSFELYVTANSLAEFADQSIDNRQ